MQGNYVSGYQSTRDGPRDSGGMDVLSLFDQQGCSKTAALEHLFRKSPTGIQMNICLEDVCQEIGMYGNIWTLPFGRYSKWISKDSWFYSLLEYNYHNDIRLHFKHATLSPNVSTISPSWR